MKGHAEKCFERYCELAKKNVSFLQVATPCIDDYLIPPEDYERTGERSAVCAQIVFKMLVFGQNWTTRFTVVSEILWQGQSQNETRLATKSC